MKGLFAEALSFCQESSVGVYLNKVYTLAKRGATDREITSLCKVMVDFSIITFFIWNKLY